MLGLGASPFLSKKAANALLNTDPTTNRPKKKQKRSAKKKAQSPKMTEQQELEVLVNDYVVIYGKQPPKYIGSKPASLRERMQNGTKLYQVACCASQTVGKWSGDWADCFVVETNFVEQTYVVVIAQNHEVRKNVPMKFVVGKEM